MGDEFEFSGKGLVGWSARGDAHGSPRATYADGHAPGPGGAPGADSPGLGTCHGTYGGHPCGDGGLSAHLCPVILGGLALMLREEFNLNGVQGTMHGVAPLMIVHGPYAQRDSGCTGGRAALGPASAPMPRLAGPCASCC